MIRRARSMAVGLVLGMTVVACNGADSGGALEPPNGTAPGTTEAGAVDVALAEWSITAQPASVASGVVRFDVGNEGTQAHEFVVLATDLAVDALPMAEGSIVDVEAEGVTLRTELEPFQAGESKDLTVSMDPGSYVLICNIAGHYQLGMRTALAVT